MHITIPSIRALEAPTPPTEVHFTLNHHIFSFSDALAALGLVVGVLSAFAAFAAVIASVVTVLLVIRQLNKMDTQTGIMDATKTLTEETKTLTEAMKVVADFRRTPYLRWCENP